jgi:hypothetical protein
MGRVRSIGASCFLYISWIGLAVGVAAKTPSVEARMTIASSNFTSSSAIRACFRRVSVEQRPDLAQRAAADRPPVRETRVSEKDVVKTRRRPGSRSCKMESRPSARGVRIPVARVREPNGG